MSKEKVEGVFAMSAKQAVEFGKRLIIAGELAKNPMQGIFYPIAPTKLKDLQKYYGEVIVYELDYERMIDEATKNGPYTTTDNVTGKIRKIGAK